MSSSMPPPQSPHQQPGGTYVPQTPQAPQSPQGYPGAPTPQTPPQYSQSPGMPMNYGMQPPVKEKKPFYKRWWFIAIVVIAVIVIITQIANGGKEDTTEVIITGEQQSTGEVVETTEEVVEEVEPAPAGYSIGQEVPVGDLVFKVTQVEVLDSIGDELFGAVPNGGKFVAVSVDVTNNGTKQTTMSSNYFKLLSGDITYESDSRADTALLAEDAGFFLQDINPGITVSGTVAFDVPEAAANPADLILQVQTGLFGTETGEIHLN